MAGKSGRGKNKGKGPNSTQINSTRDANATDSHVNSNEASDVKAGNEESCPVVENASSADEAVDSKAQETNVNAAALSNGPKQADSDIHLYPVSVKTQSGEKLELQLNPGDSVMDLRQFLLDAPETCFFTCYDLIMHAKDGSIHHLEDYNEISEVVDITTGGCSLEMVAALYDDRSIRSHVRRARELLCLSSLHSSLSTALALQHEAKQQTASEKVEVPELEGLGFMEDITGSLGNLIPASSQEIECVESIVFSSFNPAPGHRRLAGDLIYLDVVTLEEHQYCITGSTKVFYVNSSIGSMLDPTPGKPAYEATTVIGLLQKISSKFKKGFREILNRKASAHPFENVQSLLPPNPWLGVYPIPEHKRDAARAEDALVLSYGSELIGMQRDWNEELQSCREFPHNTQQERILRDRALYKVTCDFVDAATNGAVGVINRCIPPINPTDPERFHMYVHNNIFFSFAVDSDVGQMEKYSISGLILKSSQDAEHCEVLVSPNELSGKASSDLSNGLSGASSAPKSEAEHGDSGVSPGRAMEQMIDSEQATYASANNDLKGTKAYQEADVRGLHNLAMAIIDYRGHRVVAQSIIPGILQGDKSDSLLYGSVDNGRKICWDEAFHAKVVEAAKHLHLKEHTVLDGSGNAVKLAAPVECKGIIGSDDRHYLLDLMRVTPRDANYSGPGFRFCVLRPELVVAFCQAEAAEKLKSANGKDGKDTVESGLVDVNGAVKGAEVAPLNSEGMAGDDKSEAIESHDPAPFLTEEIYLNPNVLTEFKLAGNEDEIAEDEAIVRKAALYLIETVLPKFIQDLCSLEVSPMDGQTLTEALHAHGINVRYIGKVAEMTKHLPHISDLCIAEIVVRSAKHILEDVLRDTIDHDLGSAVAHFFNCFLRHDVPVGSKNSAGNVRSKTQKKDQGFQQPVGTPSKGHKKSNHGASSRKTQSVYMSITSELLWSNIQEFAKMKYQFSLPEDTKLRIKKVSVIRNLCQKVGVAIAARKYDLDAAVPFHSSDILNLQPVVKHSVPVCSEARDLVETGKVRLAEGMLNEAYSSFTEAFSILQQVTGPMHREVANCCRYLAMVLYHAGDMAGAIMQQHKELIINERCLGLDHPDTAHSYGNMALFYHGLNQTELALRHMARTLLLLSLSSGPDHPDVAATFINVAMMYQDMGKMNIALRYLQEALKKNERLLGQDHIQTAVCYHALAIAFNCMGAYKLSLQHERKTYDILVKQLGEEDSRTRDSENWIKTFKMRDLQVNAQKQKGRAVNAASAQKAFDILKAHPDLIQAFQAAASVGSNNTRDGINKSINATALMGETTLPRGRGIDERAARAAAEVRKKAAARGLLVRPHGVPVQATPPLTQFLNIINLGANPEASSPNDESDETQVDKNGQASNVGEKDNSGSSSSVCEDGGAPVGLGAGLSSLDSKKAKVKSKSTA
ncbi:hypothetical protein AMTRI_Chr03g139130 [Amborella trichopoda]